MGEENQILNYLSNYLKSKIIEIFNKENNIQYSYSIFKILSYLPMLEKAENSSRPQTHEFMYT